MLSGTCAHLFYETRFGLTSPRFRHARLSGDLGLFKFVFYVHGPSYYKSVLKRTQLSLSTDKFGCNHESTNQVKTLDILCLVMIELSFPCKIAKF